MKDSIFDTLKKNLIKLTESYDGISGKITLNKAGDRIDGQYELWRIDDIDDQNHFKWITLPLL